MIDTIDVDYQEEIKAKSAIKALGADELSAVIEKAKKHILAKSYIIPDHIRSRIRFSLKITDALSDNVLTIDFRGGNTLFSVAAEPGKDIDLLIELKSKTLCYAIDNEWGGDAIIIGYGAEIFIYNEASVEFEYENYCVRLLSRYPNTREYLKKSPLRAIKYLLADDIKRRNLLNKVLRNPSRVIEYSDAILGKRNLWLGKSKCDVCKACNI